RPGARPGPGGGARRRLSDGRRRRRRGNPSGCEAVHVAAERRQRMAPTRRIVMFNRVTMEGYFAGPDGSLDWVVPEDEIDKAGASAVSNFDTILFGRRTYEIFAQYWPHALDASGAAEDPHHTGRRSPELRAMATMLNEATKVVFSRTLRTAAWRNSRLAQEVGPREVDAVKKQARQGHVRVPHPPL